MGGPCAPCVKHGLEQEWWRRLVAWKDLKGSIEQGGQEVVGIENRKRLGDGEAACI